MNVWIRAIVGIALLAIALLIVTPIWRWGARTIREAQAWTQFCKQTSATLGDNPLHASVTYRRGLIYVDRPGVQWQIPAHRRASNPSNCETLVLASVTDIGTGQHYTNGAPARRRTVTLRVIDCRQNAVTAERSFEGGPPPSAIRASSSAGIGPPPDAKVLADWIMSLPEGPPDSVAYGGENLLRLESGSADERAVEEGTAQRALDEIAQHGNAQHHLDLLNSFLLSESDEVVHRVLTLLADCEWKDHPIRSTIVNLNVGSHRKVRLTWLVLMEQLPSNEASAFPALSRFLLTSDSPEEGVRACRALAAFGAQAIPVLTEALETDTVRAGALPVVAELVASGPTLDGEIKEDLVFALYGAHRALSTLASTLAQHSSAEKQRSLAADTLSALGYSPDSLDSVIGPQWQERQVGWSAAAWRRSTVPLKEFAVRDGFREQVAISDRGSFVAAASQDRIYLASSRLHSVFHYEFASRAGLESINFTSSERELVAKYAVETGSSATESWSTISGSSIEGPSSPIWQAKATVQNGTVTFATTKGEREIQFPGPRTPDMFGHASAVVMAPNDRFVVIGTTSGFLCFLGVRHGEIVHSLRLANTGIVDVAVSSNSSCVAALLEDRIELMTRSEHVGAGELSDIAVHLNPSRPAEEAPIFVNWGPRNASEKSERMANELAVAYRVDQGEWVRQRLGRAAIGRLPAGVHTMQYQVRSVFGSASEIISEEFTVGKWVENVVPNAGKAIPYPVVSADGALLMVAGKSENEVLIWRIESGTRHGRIKLESRPARLATGPHGLSSIVLATGKFVLLNERGRILPETTGGVMISGQVACVAHSPKHLVFGVMGNNVIQARPMNLDNRIELDDRLWPTNYREREFIAQTVVWLPSEQIFFGCDHFNVGADFTAWDPTQPATRYRIRWEGLPNGGRMPRPSNLLAAGRWLAVHTYGSVYIFHPERIEHDLRLIFQGEVKIPTGGGLAHVDLSPDGAQLLTVTKSGRSELWSTDPPSLQQVLAEEGQAAAVFGRGGDSIVLIGKNDSVSFRSYKTGE